MIHQYENITTLILVVTMFVRKLIFVGGVGVVVGKTWQGYTAHVGETPVCETQCLDFV